MFVCGVCVHVCVDGGQGCGCVGVFGGGGGGGGIKTTLKFSQTYANTFHGQGLQ